jgi:hypothetical protein
MKAKWIPALIAGALTLGFGDDKPNIEYKPLSIAAFQEFGTLQSGVFGGATEGFKKEWTDHFGAFLTQEATINGNLTLRVGLGGIFEFQKSEMVGSTWGGTQYKNFFNGPTVADANYSFGSGSIGLGMFPFKYNRDAHNLGEYLFRSGPYPGYIGSGGYSYVGDNQAYLQGFKSKWTFGNLSADLLLLTETSVPPLYDLSLAGLVRYSIGEGLLDLTGGVNLKRLVPIRPSRTSRKSPSNAYFTNQYGTWTGKVAFYDESAAFYKSKADSAGKIAKVIETTDSAGAAKLRQDSAAFMVPYAAVKANADSVRAWTDPARADKPSYEYYTQSGIMATFAASLDLKKFIHSDVFGPNDLRLYTEVAVLGLKDYPVFYEKINERVPVMFGFNLPGFKFFDLISIQAEFYNSPWLNSYEESGSTNEATPAIPKGKNWLYSEQTYKDVTADDNLYWSLMIRKELIAGLSFTAQAARDHIRSVSTTNFFGPGTDPNEILYSNKDWYWMVQFSFGI